MIDPLLGQLIFIGLDNENVSGMYIRVTTNTKGTAYYHLVESYRDGGKVKQRTLLSLGRVEDGTLEQLAEAISKHTDKIPVFNMAKDVDVNDTYILGTLLVLDRMMAEHGLSGCLSMLQSKHKKLRFDLKKVIFTQLCSRFVKPVSKLSLYDNWLGRMDPGLVEHETAIQHLYRSLDLLYEHKEEIETTLGEDRCIITWSRIPADRAYKKYLLVKGETLCTLNLKAITKDSKKDGFFGIITNVKEMSATEIGSNYKELWRIEKQYGYGQLYRQMQSNFLELSECRYLPKSYRKTIKCSGTNSFAMLFIAN